MPAQPNSVWAIDIGNNSLKALHLSYTGGAVEVIGFDNTQHGKILNSVGGAERDELIALSLREFVTQNDLGKDDVIVSVPSQNSFARFVNLPPVERKRIPEIVRFEAAQQIPFDIDDVQWDWQTMSEPGSAQTKVGIFAIKNEVVTSALEHFGRENITVRYVQMAPMALYNYAMFDYEGTDLTRSDNRATVILDIGAANTDLVVATRSSVWQRCIPMGGNAFTRAIADAFKISFDKAEKLKRTAAMSKYARQIFQAMRPVFSDLASEIQRSLGFYSSSHSDTKLSKVIALGGGTKMRGLLKYLHQTIQIPIERPDSFKRLAIGSGVSAAKFHDNVGDFGIVYGLAVQGVGLARVECNLLPRSIARSMAWAGKAKHFLAAACILLLVSLMCLLRASLDRISYGNKSAVRADINNIIQAAGQAQTRLDAEKSKAGASKVIMEKEFELFNYRDVIPLLHETIISTLPNSQNNPEQEQLYQAFNAGDVERVREIPRKDRKQIFITSMSVQFTDDLSSEKFSTVDSLRRRTRRDRTSPQKEEYDGEDDEHSEFGIVRRRGPARRAMPGRGLVGGRTGATMEKKEAGFMVTITGYSPYRDLGELMEPIGAGNDRTRWGVVNRLLHLDEIADGNSPFKLYERTDVSHFKLEIGKVSVEEQTPAGVGLSEYRDIEPGGIAEEVLIDPMTREVINDVAELEEGKEKLDRSGNVIYKANDHWFVLNAKFIWKNAPAKPLIPGRTLGGIRRTGR